MPLNYIQNNQTNNNYGSNIQIVPMNNLQNNNLIQQLNDEKLKNKRFEEEIQRLKSINNNLNNELNSLKNNIQILKNENNNLKLMLSNTNQLNQFKQVNINEINRLKQIISKKDDEIKELQSQLKINVNMKDIIVINFISTDQEIRRGIPCLPNDIFSEVEEKLYQQDDECKKYRDTNNILLFNGTIILRFKTVKENNIHNGDTVQIVKPEEFEN